MLAKYNLFHFIVFLDTGAPTNIMSYDTYIRYFNREPLILEDSYPDLSDLHGNSLGVKGRITLPFVFANTELLEEVYIVGSGTLPGHLLMGFPTMLKNKIVLDNGNDAVGICSNFVEYYKPVSTNTYNFRKRSKSDIERKNVKGSGNKLNCVERNTTFNLSVKKDVILESSTVHFITCRTHKRANDTFAITLPEIEKNRGKRNCKSNE